MKPLSNSKWQNFVEFVNYLTFSPSIIFYEFYKILSTENRDVVSTGYLYIGVPIQENLVKGDKTFFGFCKEATRNVFSKTSGGGLLFVFFRSFFVKIPKKITFKNL